MVERKKGDTWNENLVFRRNISSESNEIPEESNLLLDYTVTNFNVYTCTLNRSFAQARDAELSNVNDFYNGWFMDFCGQVRTVTDYTSSEDDEGVVIGRFTLDSNFDEEPANGSNMRLIDPDEIAEEEQVIAKVDAESEAQFGGDNQTGLISNNQLEDSRRRADVFKYQIREGTDLFFVDFLKPVKTGSINVSTLCTPISVLAAQSDVWMEQIGIFLDTVPEGTKMRYFLEDDTTLNIRYPLLENVTLDEFNQGLGDLVTASDYSDETSWNLNPIRIPTLLRLVPNFRLTFSFSDSTGTPVFFDVPIDTSITDFPSFRDVRSDQIQAVDGLSITLDTGADPSDNAYNGMRLYFGSEFRDIIDYDGSTKVATVDSAYTTTPSPGDDYIIKIAFIRPMMVFQYREVVTSRVQDKNNRRDYSFSDDGAELEIGTANYVDTTDGALTLDIPFQGIRTVGGWFEIVDKESNFDTNNVTINFDASDRFEGVRPFDFICDEKDVRYLFRYVSTSFGWTVEKFNVKTYGSMFQANASNTITIDTQNVFFPIDGFTEGETENVTFQNGNELKVTIPGKYIVNYTLCWTGGVNTAYGFEIVINGTHKDETQSCGRLNNANDIFNSSSDSILDLAVDDVVTLEVINFTNTSDLVVSSANVSIHKIRD